MFHRLLVWYCSYCADQLVDKTSKRKGNKKSRLSVRPRVYIRNDMRHCASLSPFAECICLQLSRSNYSNVELRCIFINCMNISVWLVEVRSYLMFRTLVVYSPFQKIFSVCLFPFFRLPPKIGGELERHFAKILPCEIFSEWTVHSQKSTDQIQIVLGMSRFLHNPFINTWR